MATWIAHMRIAEHFMNVHESLNNTAFLVGNIAPDSGVPNEDWSAFTPDGNISHWRNADGINAERFKKEYLQPENEKYPFYLGYYFHLLTDIEWTAFFMKKRQEPIYAEGLNANEKFIWEIKKDWYGQDRVYLQENKESVFFTRFSKIRSFPNIYLDYFPDDAFMHRIDYITKFYLDRYEDEDPNRAFPFLSKGEMDAFVSGVIGGLEKHCPLPWQFG